MELALPHNQESKARRFLYNEFSLIVGLVAMAFWVFTWFNNGFTKNDSEMATLDKRVAIMEKMAEQVPVMQKSINDTNAKLDTLIGQFQQLNRTMAR